jgi:hypothetical protein
MNPKKSKEKDRRRARKLAEEAWEAVDAGNLDLAEKLIRRAVTTQEDNPVLWNDQGVILGLRDNAEEATQSFRGAIRLAPTYAEPFAHLAEMEAKAGYLRDAIAYLEKAVRHAPDKPAYAERLEALRLLASERSPAIEPAAPATPKTEPRTPAPTGHDWPARVAKLDWDALGKNLTSDGCVLIPELLDSDSCQQVRELFDEDSLFAKTVVMDREDYGKGTYRYFQAPIPALVDELRRAVYPHAAEIANAWQDRLGEPARFPAEWEFFREVCRQAGQTVPTPILLRYETGGFNALHRDLRGTVFFPIQMAVVLSPRADEANSGFRGGDFLFCDVPETKKSRRRELVAGLGDAVLFCTRDRLVKVGGAFGLQPVKHGVSTIEAGTRVVLGVPFHEYR